MTKEAQDTFIEERRCEDLHEAMLHFAQKSGYTYAEYIATCQIIAVFHDELGDYTMSPRFERHIRAQAHQLLRWMEKHHPAPPPPSPKKRETENDEEKTTA